MIPQSYPLYATLAATDSDDAEHVWAIIGWQPPNRPGEPMNAHVIAMGAGDLCGEQRTVQPDMVWPTAESAAEFLAERRATIDDIPYVTPDPDYVSVDYDDDLPPDAHGSDERPR